MISPNGDACTPHIECNIPNCLECGTPSTICLRCDASEGFYASAGACMACDTTRGKYVPPDGSGCFDCEAGCLECSDSSTCRKCDRAQNYYLSGSDCVKCQITERKFIPPSGDSCLDCQKGCLLCANRETCSSCDASQGYVLEGQSCKFCNKSESKFVNTQANPPTCEPCSKNCEECTSKTNCTKCSQDYQVDSKGACVEKPASIESFTLLQALPSDTDDEADFKLKVSIPGSGKFGSQLTFDTFKSPNPNPRKLFKVEANSQTPAVGTITSLTRLTKKRELIILGTFATQPTSGESPNSIDVGLKVNVLIDNIINTKPSVGLTTDPVSTTVKITPKIEKKAVEAAATQGEAMGGASSASSSAAVGVSTAFSALGGDPTGLMIKFNQYLDFISRLRLININFGAKLEAFLGSVGEMKEIKAESDDEKDDIIKAQNGDKGKFNKYFVKLEFNGRLMYKSGFFLLSWGVKVIGMVLLGFVTAHPQKVNKFALYWIFWSRKLHILVLGTTMTDISFYGVRVLLHSSRDEIKRHPIKYIFNTLAVYLVGVDLIQIFLIVVNLNEKPPNPVSVSNKEDDLVMDSAKQPMIKKNQILSRNPRAEGNQKDEGENGERKRRESSELGKKNLIAEVVKKEIDNEKTIRRIQRDESIKLFSIADLTPTNTVFVSKICLLNNYFFILKMAFQLAILASLPHLPSFQISLMLGAQVLDMVINIYQFCKRRHLKSWIKMILRVSSAFFISLFLVIGLYIRVKFGTKALYIDKGVQDIGNMVVIAGVGVEYLLTIILVVEMLVVAIKAWMNKKKIKKRKEKEELIGREDGEIYSVTEIKDPICYKVTKRVVDPLNQCQKLEIEDLVFMPRRSVNNKLNSKKSGKGSKKSILSSHLENSEFKQAQMSKMSSFRSKGQGLQLREGSTTGSSINFSGNLKRINLAQVSNNPAKPGTDKTNVGQHGMGNGGRPVVLNFKKGR